MTLKVTRVLALTALSIWSLAAWAAEADIEQSFDVGAGGTLLINSDAGSIRVNSWEESQVRVRVSDPGDFDVSLEQNGNDVSVYAESDRGGWWGSRSRIEFVVMVPMEYNLDLDTGGGEIIVSALSGSVRADTSGGGIEIGAISGGNVQADTSGGSIEIADVDGDVVADTSGGRINIGNVTGSVEADTSGGRITIGDVDGDIYADTSGGNITVGRGGGRVELDTSGGTIRADWAMGEIEADTSGGNIYLAGSATRVVADTSGGNIEIEGSGGSVEADTSGGSITIRNSVGPIRADTAGGRIDAELAAGESLNKRVELETRGGDITIRIPEAHAATITANLEVSRRNRSDYQIFTDFPLAISEDDRGNIVGQGDINGGGDRIYLETVNSDINIVSY